MYRIRRFNVLKTSTVVAVMYMLVIAVVAIPFLLLIAIVGVSVNGGQEGAGAIGVVGALLGAVLLALFYGLIGWVFTAIACVVYNIAAGWLGGIEIQVEPVAPAQPPPAWLNPGAISPTVPPTAPPTAPPSDPMVRVV